MYDIVIRHGLIVDGSGNPGFTGDIAISGDSIQAISNSIFEKGKKEIDASGKVVCPGFIDPHVHEEWICFADNRYELFLRQGVTTVVNGNCGHSIFPGPREAIIDYYWGNGLMSSRQREVYKQTFPEWEDFNGYARAVEKTGISVNFITLLGHGTIRWSVMNGAHDRPPSEEEDEQIEQIIRQNMQQGAWGISFGLDYVPSRYAQMEELVRVTRLIQEYDGVAAAHLRHAIGVLEATEEFLEVGKRSGVKLQVSHLRATVPEAFAAVEKAIAEGVRARIDTIPRSTGHCTSKARLIQFIMALSDDLFNTGEEGVKRALHTSEGRKIIQKDAYIFSGDKSNKFIVLSEDPSLEGRSVKDIAAERGQDADECMLDLLGDDKQYVFWLGGPVREDFPDQGHADSIIRNPYVSVGTDEILGDPEDPYDWYELQRRGGFPIFMQMYLQASVPVEEIVRRNTSMVAAHFGIERRGQIKAGNFADLAVIDLENYQFPSPDKVDYRKPLTMASGVEAVIVNGTLVIDSGELVPALPGRVLKKTL